MEASERTDPDGGLALGSRKQDLDTFDRWFEWSQTSLVVDLCSYPQLREER